MSSARHSLTSRRTAAARAAARCVVRDGWGSLDAIAASGGNLYLLDVKSNQVWRYLPGQGGFDSERTGLIDSADLSSANGARGRARTSTCWTTKSGHPAVRGKAEAPFTLAGIDPPLDRRRR